jgi:hypothetical protein
MNEHINEPAFEVVLQALKETAEQHCDSPFLTACEITWALIEAGHLPAQPGKPH